MNTHIVKGFRAGILRLRLRLAILRISLGIYKNPVIAFSMLRALIRKRQLVHGNARITKFVRSGARYFWVTDFPGFPSKAFNDYVANELNAFRNFDQSPTSLQTIIFGITNRCPLKCNHCYEWENLDSTEHLSLSELKLILQKIREQNICHVQLSGGEPLVRFDDLLSLIQAGDGIDFWLLTSGFGLTLEKAISMKQSGLIGVQISLDHWDEHLHNEFRNNERSFEWVRNAVENCLQAGIVVSLSLCATREFISESNLHKYTELAKEWGVHFIRILEPRSTGRFANLDVQLRDMETEMLGKYYINYNMQTKRSDHPVLIYPGYHQRKLGCFGAGNRYMYIDSNAGFHACPFCLEVHGNALSTSFADAIYKIKERKCHAFQMSEHMR